MARPRYETAEHLRREAALAYYIECCLPYRLIKLKGPNEAKYRLDYVALLLHSNRVAAWIETKVRSGNFAGRRAVYLSADKWRSGVALWGASLPGFCLIYQFNDGVFIHTYNPNRAYGVYWGGRTSPARDEGDREPMVRILSAWWSRLVLPPLEERSGHGD